jgi:hypothetical protein
MTAQERGDALPPGAFDRPYPAMTAAERWHLDVYLPYSEMCMFDVLVLLLPPPPLLLLKARITGAGMDSWSCLILWMVMSVLSSWMPCVLSRKSCCSALRIQLLIYAGMGRGAVEASSALGCKARRSISWGT